MSVITSAILIILGLLMFRLNIEKKLMLFIFSITCLSAFNGPIPFLRSSLFVMSLFFFLSEMRRFGAHFSIMKRTKIFTPLCLMVLATIVLFFNSPNYNKSIGDGLAFFRDNLIAAYFILAYAYLAFSGEQSLYKLFKLTRLCLILLTFFGLVNLIVGRPVFLEVFSSGKNVASHFIERSTISQSSFRICSMFVNSFDYGFYCITILLFHLYCFTNKIISKKTLYLMIGCALFGIVTCGSRTILLTAFISIACYCIFYFKSKKLIVLIIGFIFAYSVAYSFVPKFADTVDWALSALSSSELEGRSSLAMREIQWTSVLYHTKDHMILGRGYGFFLKDLGYASGKLLDQSLMGLEGVHLNIMLERGVFGLTCYYIFWLFMCMFALKNRQFNRSTSCFLLSIIAAYLFFAHGTGQLSSLPITLIFIGISVKVIDVQRKSNALYTR